ncbi:aldo/keto reductase [Leptospira interrogans]
MRSVEESLARLGLDHVDVLLVHDPDDHYKEAADGTFRALQRLRADGTVKAIGAGMNQSEMCSGPPAESNRPARLRRSGRAAIPAFGEASEETRDRAGASRLFAYSMSSPDYHFLEWKSPIVSGVLAG